MSITRPEVRFFNRFKLELSNNRKKKLMKILTKKRLFISLKSFDIGVGLLYCDSSLMLNTEMAGRAHLADKKCKDTHVAKRTDFRLHAFKGFYKVSAFHQKYLSFECSFWWNGLGDSLRATFISVLLSCREPTRR